MILRKPYAFLIKHFQKIHLVLLLLASYILYKNMRFSSMVEDYLVSKYYNPSLMPMSEYASFLVYFVLFLIILASCVLIYLLYHKKKPVVVYGFVALEYLAVIISFSYAASYFNETGFGMIHLQQAMLVRDVLFIVSIPQYVILILLGIRSLGLDLKRFGFSEDQEFIEIQEEDREEFEVEVGFDVNNIKRGVRQKLRFFRYFLLENKMVILLVVCFVFLIFGYRLYHLVFIENKVYHLGDTLRANIYEMKINQVYFTGKDYAGNQVNQERRKYIVVDLNIKNMADVETTIDTNKFVIAANYKFYAPIRTHDEYFVDLGKGYQGEKIAPSVDNHFILVYEIMPEDFGSDYTLYYEEIMSRSEVKLREFDVPILDLSEATETVSKNLNEEIEIAFYHQGKENFTISSYQLLDQLTYLYTSCYVWDCRVYEGTLKSSSYSSNPLLLKLDYQGEQDGLAFSNFLVKYAKIVYQTDKWEKQTIRLPLSRKWKGNYSYLLIPREIESSEVIYLEFQSRDKNYRYYLKGGVTDEG